MASPPLWLGKLNSLTDAFDAEISSDLDQRIPSSFGNKSWAIMTYLRAGPVSVGGSKSKCVIVRVTVLEQGHCSPRKLIHQGPWANTSRCFTGPAIGMFAHARQLQQNWKSSTKQCLLTRSSTIASWIWASRQFFWLVPAASHFWQSWPTRLKDLVTADPPISIPGGLNECNHFAL